MLATTTALTAALALTSPVDTATPAPAAQVTAEAEATPSDATEADQGASDEPIVGRNAVVLGTHAKIPDWSMSLGYQRVLGKRFSVGAGLEYAFQPQGYWHLQGIAEVLSGQVWLGRPFNGVFGELSMGIAHQFLARQPSLTTTSLVPGLSLGFRWTHRTGLSLGASGGLRWGRTVSDSEIICTRPKYCTSVRQGAYARITVDLGFVF